MFFPFKRCIILSGQSIQAFTRTHVEVYMYYTGFPTQRGLFLLAQTINCHSYELAIPILFFLKLLSLWFNVRDLYYFFFHTFRNDTTPAWNHSDWVRAEEKFKCLFPHSLTSGPLALSLIWTNLCPAKNPLWQIIAQGGTGLHEKSTFPTESLSPA